MDYNKTMELDENLNQIDFILIQNDYLVNQNSRYYKLQLLVSKSQKNDYYVFSRWGKLGLKGQFQLSIAMTKDLGVKQYDKKFKQKNLIYKEDYKEN